MSQRRYYLALLGMVMIMISGVTLLIADKARRTGRNPGDVVWMERIRRNALDSLTPLRSRVIIVKSDNLAVEIGGTGRSDGSIADKPARIRFEPGDPDIPVEIIHAARNNVLKTSEWRDGVPFNAPPSPPHAKRLFEIKDYLWDITLKYIDNLELVYNREEEVPSRRIAFLEQALETNKGLLDREIERLGLEPVE